ncbi:WGxxGxxG family protein [Paenibacillus sp. CCS19]|uniref:WGxxGxxG family protein n=1 Tax=Paenibacillus sp. CCS19 TaxID=3158387 RepID=UPI00295E6108|nr:WGxxGxxG family protein [Paenibacillus cellulosilyticus]
MFLATMLMMSAAAVPTFAESNDIEVAATTATGNMNTYGTNNTGYGNNYGNSVTGYGTNNGLNANNYRANAADDNDFDWGWLGLLGLAGLFGLRSRDRERT